jgi:anti-sigma regulatory factor (Ser/Thr protein kinase)
MTSRSPSIIPLAHDAFVYDSDASFLQGLVPFLRDGVEAGQPVMAVTTPDNADLLTDALGHVAHHVRFLDAAEWYRRPAGAVAGYRHVLDGYRELGAERVRVVGEVNFGQTEAERRAWLRYEAALNRVFANASAWIVCPYDARVLPAAVVDAAFATHPHVFAPSGRRRIKRYTDPAAYAMRLIETDEPEGGRLVAVHDVDGDLLTTRRMVEQTARTVGLEPPRAEQFAVAVNEVITNAMLHGAEPIRLRVWVDGASLILEVADEGPGLHDPFAGLTAPRPEDGPEGGMGLWLATQLCDGLDILPRAAGATVRLRMEVQSPPSRLPSA